MAVVSEVKCRRQPCISTDEASKEESGTVIGTGGILSAKNKQFFIQFFQFGYQRIVTDTPTLFHMKQNTQTLMKCQKANSNAPKECTA